MRYQLMIKEINVLSIHLMSLPHPIVPCGFCAFSIKLNKITWERVSQYLAQLGEAGSLNELKVHLFLLSLTGTAFSWFSSLPHGSIRVCSQLEQKFHDHFYSGDDELKLSHLT